MPNTQWTAEKEKELAEIYQRKSLDQLAEHFNTNVRSLQVKMSRMKLKKGHAHEVAWTEDKDEYLRVFAKEKTPWEMAQKLRMTVGQVETRMQMLGLMERPKHGHTRSATVCGNPRPPAQYSNPDYSGIDRYYQKERNSYYAQ